LTIRMRTSEWPYFSAARSYVRPGAAVRPPRIASLPKPPVRLAATREYHDRARSRRASIHETRQR
jgi:hypothetical protein